MKTIITNRPAIPFLSLLAAGISFFSASLPAACAQTWPSITLQPASQTNSAGANATLTVAVAGTGPFSYRWLFNGINLPNDIITTVAGNGSQAYSGDGDAATNAGLREPYGVAVDASGNLYIADGDDRRIRKVDSKGVISTVAGNGLFGYSGDGGAATNASLNFPLGVAVDAAGNLYIADYYNFRIRKVDANGVMTTVAGNGTANGNESDGGPATNSSLNGPGAVALDASGNLFIANQSTLSDQADSRVRKVDAKGVISTVAGNGADRYSGDGGAATNAPLSGASGVAVDASGNLFIADLGNNRIRKVDARGVISTMAGNGLKGYSGDGGAATNAGLSYPSGVAVDASGNVFIADQGNNRIREVALAGLPSLTLNTVSATNAGDYQVIITGSYGSVTSAVARLTVAPPASRNAGIVMNIPVTSGSHLLLGFTLAQTSSAPITLLQSSSVAGPWTTNTSAVLTGNSQSGGYQFSIPMPDSVQFYQLRSP